LGEIFSTIVCGILTIFWITLLIRVILSWVPALPQPLRPVANFVRSVTDPLIVPLRGILPPVQIGAVALDLSIILLFLVVRIVQSILCRPNVLA
jgi:YggT family protein